MATLEWMMNQNELREMFRRAIYYKQKPLTEIAKECGVSRQTLTKWLKHRYDVQKLETIERLYKWTITD